MARTVVTGVAGFIGSHIAEWLVKHGHHVIGIDDLSAGYEKNIPLGVEFHEKDIYEIDKYSTVLKNVDVVFHNAASKKNICLKNPVRDLEVNGVGTLKLLNACVDNHVNKFIYASTGSVYGEASGRINEYTPRNPVSYYGISKMAGESYVRMFYYYNGLNTTVLRYFHVWGERQESNQDTGGVIAIFKDKIQKGETIFIHGDGLQSRVFTHVSDIVEANIKSWENSKSEGKVYNCSSSKQTSIVMIAKLLMEKYKKKVGITYANALPGDIYNFDVDSSEISEIGVTFKSINELL